MIKKLLVVFAAAGLISMACFTFLSILGGFPHGHGWDGAPWDGGNWNGDRSGHGRDAGPEISRNLPFTGSDQLEIHYPAEITVTQGPQARFTVTGPQRLLDQLKLDDGVLSGPYERHFQWNHGYSGHLKIDIVSPNTHRFQLAGAEKLTLKGYDQDSLILNLAGATDVEGQGKAKRLEAHIAGAGHLDLAQLSVDEAEVSIAGVADADIDPHVSANVSIAGPGHVRLRTRPPSVSSHIFGPGSIDEGPNPAPTPTPPTPPAPPTPGAKT
jgi:hypothetical protein